jgi:hypothetical protein
MDTKWDIMKKEDGNFDIFKNGELLHTTPEAWLGRQLAPYGILEGDYEDVLRQLSEAGRATVSIPPLGKFFQL